jgi:hypothetical protein
MVFKKGDRVRVKKGVSPNPGRPGTVTGFEVRADGVWYSVYLDLMSNARLPHDKTYRARELQAMRGGVKV